jgi:outer membrane protein assembly factor BamE (lipoprotein component of BamABCDE complex)
VKSFSQALTWENLGKIQRGMTRDEIRLLYGPPNDTITYKNLSEEVWSYRYNIPINDDRIYNVHFDVTSGTVRQTTDSIDELRHPISAGDGGASQ